MAWAEPKFSRELVNIAGKQLITLDQRDPLRDGALEVISNWRSCHGFPLQVIKMTLVKRAKRKVSDNALVAQRIKRLSSISLKLEHNPEMRLSQMQDIGGCRAVLENVTQAERLVAVYEEAHAKKPKATDRPLLIKKFNYIECPKPDGYRSIHLIMRYQSASKEFAKFNGQKIEIQIRSKLQHAWATAVETCQTFTGQALKSKIKSASETWLTFFALMSSAIATREKRPLVPNTPTDRSIRKRLIKELVAQESIITLLSAWNTAIKRQEDATNKQSVAFLLELDTAKKMLRMIPFREDEMLFAEARYMEREKETEKNQDIQIVLVSADSVAALRRAYPNYYVDTSAFIEAIKQEIY
jgi:ppGpp synthetase/RelA/SpoT-type nucleotidyltranferase